MKTTHLEQKRKALVEKREKLIARFSDAARKRQKTARVCAELRRTNEFRRLLDQTAGRAT